MGIAFETISLAGKTKVCGLDKDGVGATIQNENIARLDVSVYDLRILCVEVGKTIQRLCKNLLAFMVAEVMASLEVIANRTLGHVFGVRPRHRPRRRVQQGNDVLLVGNVSRVVQ